MAGLTPDERRRLEEKLLGDVRVAEAAYRAAAAEFQHLREEYGDALGTVDGAYAVHAAARRERIMLQQYSRVLKAFSKFIMDGNPPALSDE